MPTMAELKKLTTGGRKDKYGTRLYVAEHDGIYWATNAYWLVPAARLAVLLEHFNLPTDAAGTYEVNSKLAKLEQDQPPLGRFLENTYDVELTRTTIDDIGYAYAEGGDILLAVYDHPHGGHVFFNRDFHAWILATLEESRGYGERWKADSLKVRQASRSLRSLGPVSFSAVVEKRHGGHYREDRTWEPETWTDDHEETFAILMPVCR